MHKGQFVYPVAPAHAAKLRGFLLRLIARLLAAGLLLSGLANAAEQRTVRVGTIDNPPIVFRESTGEVKGIAIDVLNYVAQKEGWRLEFVHSQFQDALMQLERGEIDLLTGIAHTPERANRFQFTDQMLLSNWGIVYARPGARIQSLLDLQHQRVAMSSGATHSQALSKLLKEFGVSITPVVASNYSEVFALIASGQADAGVVSRVFSATHSADYNVDSTGIVLNPIEVRFASPKNAAPAIVSALDRHLKVLLKDSGSAYFQSLDQWLGLGIAKKLPEWVQWVLIGITATLLLTVFFLFLLRRQVRAQAMILRDAEESYRVTFNHAPTGIARVGPDGSWLEVNQRLCDIVGYTRSELLKLSFQDITHPDDLETDLDYVRQVLAGEINSYNLEKRYLHKSGRSIWIRLTVSLVRKDDGSPKYFVSVIEDISQRKQAEQALQSADERFRRAFRLIPNPLTLQTKDGVLIHCSDAFCEATGYTREQVLGHNTLELDLWANPEQRSEMRKQLHRDGLLDNFEFQLRPRNGPIRTMQMSARYLTDEPETTLLVVTHDITERKAAEATLQEGRQRLLALSAMSSDWFWQQDAQFRFTDFTGAFANDFTPPVESMGKTLWELNIDLMPEHWAAHRAILKAHLPFRNFEYPITGIDGELSYYSINGEPMLDETGRFIGYHGTGSDITARKQAEEKIHELAFFDPLTGLPNRTLLLDRLKQTIVASSRSGGHAALLIIDLDNFKTLNDTRGHDIGDLLLQQVAQRLKLAVREGDTVARLGGDEFVVILAALDPIEVDAARDVEAVSEKILAALGQTYTLGDGAHHSTASIGVTLFMGDLTSSDDLLKQADLAMYRAKTAGRNGICFFAPTMESSVRERAALENDLRLALTDRQYLLHYQAQVADGQMTGVEALVRWQHPQRGLVSPAEFIPLAEETGLILPLGGLVLETACAQLAIWATRAEMNHLTIAVNVSAHQFRQADFVDQLLLILKNSGADPQRLKLELTESLLVSNVDEVIEKMYALKARGVGFSLDDFGTGFSSLSYLKRLPLDQLKIDQSFVREILTDPNDASIARTIIALAKNLGLGVIAEGVETEAQRDFLARSGCHAYQGYLFSRPLPIEDFELFARQL